MATTAASETEPFCGMNGSIEVPNSVLIYSHSWLPGQVDGVAIRMMAHVKELVSRGVQVTVVTPDFVPYGELKGDAAKPPTLLAIPGVVEHVTIQTQRTPVYRKNLCMRYSLQNFQDLIAVIQRTKPDIVHGTQEASMQVLASACLVCDVPLVVSVHTDVVQIANRDGEFSPMGSSMLGRMHCSIAVYCVNWGYRNWALSGLKYFCVSKQAKRLLDDAGVGPTNVAEICWGPMVDREIFRIDLPADQIAAERKRLTFGMENAYLMVSVGRVTAEKDIGFLVEALKRAPKNVILALVGSGSMAEELKKLHGLEHRLHCTGDFINREGVALALRASDVCVSASTMETIGLTAMEAVSCGTPFLAANAQGFKEHMEHGKNARLFEPHSEASFDAELAEMMKSGGQGNWGREALRESIAWASLTVCTDNALKAYTFARKANYRVLRLGATLGYLGLNWMFGSFLG